MSRSRVIEVFHPPQSEVVLDQEGDYPELWGLSPLQTGPRARPRRRLLSVQEAVDLGA